MRLETLYQARFTAPESWSVELAGAKGIEGQKFLLTEGRCEGRIEASWRGANYPRQRTDGTLIPDFRGVLQTDDGATILFAWQGYGRATEGNQSRLVGAMTHITDDARYRWLNQAMCAVAGEVVRPDGSVEVVIEVSELVWEPVGHDQRTGVVPGRV